MPGRRSLSLLICALLPVIAMPAKLAAQTSDLERRISESRKKAGATKADVAREALEENRIRREKLEQRLSEIKQWTKAQFELSERDVIDKPKAMASILSKWQNQRENELHRLLQFRDKSAGGIESGKALNTMLEHIGPAANENSVARKLNPLYGLPLYEGTTGQKIDKGIIAQLQLHQQEPCWGPRPWANSTRTPSTWNGRQSCATSAGPKTATRSRKPASGC